LKDQSLPAFTESVVVDAARSRGEKLFRFKTTGDGARNYTYDTLNRLVEALNPLPSNPQESCDYDPVGNRTNSNQNGASTFNQANQLLEDANFNLPVRQ